MIGHCTLRYTTLCTDSHLIRNDYSNSSNVMNYGDDDDNGNGGVMSATATSTWHNKAGDAWHDLVWFTRSGRGDMW